MVCCSDGGVFTADGGDATNEMGWGSVGVV